MNAWTNFSASDKYLNEYSFRCFKSKSLIWLPISQSWGVNDYAILAIWGCSISDFTKNYRLYIVYILFISYNMHLVELGFVEAYASSTNNIS